MTRLHRSFVDSRWGQLHLRSIGEGPLPPLVCLHATAYSSLTFAPLMPLLARGRRVIAVDTPGYGDSDGPDEPVPFEHYAQAILEALPALAGPTPVDLFGYHTGALIATGMAVAAPASIDRLVLIGIPFFEGPEHAAWKAKLVHRHALTEDFAQFADRWTYFVTHRTPGLSLHRAYQCFVDELKAYPADWWAHASLFERDIGADLQRVDQPVLVLNPDSALSDASRRAAAVMKCASVVDMPAWKGAIFDLQTVELAGAIDTFLGRE